MKKYIITEEQIRLLDSKILWFNKGKLTWMEIDSPDTGELKLEEYKEPIATIRAEDIVFGNKPQKDISYHTKRLADATEILANVATAEDWKEQMNSKPSVTSQEEFNKLKDRVDKLEYEMPKFRIGMHVTQVEHIDSNTGKKTTSLMK